jgi:hypothetical protein
MVGNRAAFASPTRLKAAPFGGDDVRAPLEQFRRQTGRHGIGLSGQLGGDARGRCRIAADHDLQRPDRLLTRELDLPQPVAIQAEVGLRHFDVLVVADADLRARLRQGDETLAAADGLPRQLRLQTGFRRQEPAARDGCRDRLARELEVGLGGPGVGGRRGASVSDATPEIELPDERQRGALEPRVVARHLAAAASQDVDRWIELGARELGVKHRLLDAGGGHAQIGVVGDRFGDGRTQLIVTVRGEPVVGDESRASAGGGPLLRYLDGRQRLFFDRRRVRRRLQRARRQRHQRDGQRRGRRRAPARVREPSRVVHHSSQCPRLMLCLMMM